VLSTSSQGSVGSPKDSRAPACPRFSSAKLSRSGGSCCASTGHPCPATPTCVSSQLSLYSLLSGVQTSCALDSPAQISPAQAREKGSTGPSLACGGKPTGSSKDSDPVGSFLKTSLLSNLAGLTRYSARWKRSATPAGRSWWVLALSEPPKADASSTKVGASESGSLLDWPTPTKSRYGSSNNGSPGDGRTQYATRGALSLEGAAREADAQAKPDWPTPTRSDVKSSRRHGYMKKGNPGTTLLDAIDEKAGDWGTPRCADGAASPLVQRAASKGRLEDQVAHMCGLPTDGNEASAKAKSRAPSRRLSARWILQLQGYPSNWLDVPTDWLLKLLGTR